MGQTKPEPPSALCWLISRKKALALLLEGLPSLPCLYSPLQTPVWELFFGCSRGSPISFSLDLV